MTGAAERRHHDGFAATKGHDNAHHKGCAATKATTTYRKECGSRFAPADEVSTQPAGGFVSFVFREGDFVVLRDAVGAA